MVIFVMFGTFNNFGTNAQNSHNTNIEINSDIFSILILFKILKCSIINMY